MTTTKTAKRRTRKTRPVQPEAPQTEQASAEQDGKRYQRCPQVVQIPEGCPKCGSTRPDKIGNTTPRALRGTVQGENLTLSRGATAFAVVASTTAPGPTI